MPKKVYINVFDVKTKEKVMRGCIKDVAKFLYIDHSTIYHYLDKGKVFDGKYTLSRDNQDINLDVDDQIAIVKKFYNEYYRSPRDYEFIECGGDIEKVKALYESYVNFLQDFGYEKPRRFETYEAIDENGNVVFVGTTADIQYEYGIKPSNIHSYIKGNIKAWNCDDECVTFRKKLFKRNGSLEV